MKIKILTLFPNIIKGFISESIIKRAIDANIVSIDLIDIRDYSTNKHHKVDDTPYGGGAGMVMQVDIVASAIKANSSEDSHILLMTPQGHKFTNKDALRYSKEDELVIVCGHYEGFDERIRDYVDEEVSIGDFVLTGGEIPAMAISDSVIRLLDGSINELSYEDDSFYNGLLEYPQYTRPYEYDGKKVPDVLVNGNHKLINEFRHKESLKKTLYRRPDLLEKLNLSEDDLIYIEELKKG